MENNKSNTIRNLLIISFIFIIVGFGLFIIYQAKINPNTNNTSSQNTNNTLSQNTNSVSEEAIQKAKEELIKQNTIISKEENNNILWWITGLIVIILIGGIFLYFYYFKQKEENIGLKQPVPINRLKEIFKEIISKEYGLGWYLNDNKFYLRNEREFYFRDQRVWFHRATGDKFVTIEFVVNNGPMYGLHMATIPADKGEKLLWEQEWSIIHKTDMKDYKLLSKTYPVTSLTDKQERQKMYIAEQIASGDLPKDSMSSFQSNMGNDTQKSFGNSKPILQSPFMNSNMEGYEGDEGLDDMEGDEGLSNMSSTQYPRTRTSYYKRRRR